MSLRVERNLKLANAASPNVSLPSSKKYRDNYDMIFKKKHTPKKVTK